MENKKGKIIVISAPSGCGKSTIINNMLDAGDLPLNFSVSATNRAPRAGEVDGVHYYFMSTEDFRNAVADKQFIEWEEVYPGRYYGTLKNEVQRAIERGENIILDIDVKGAMNVKELFGDDAMTVFILPPSIDALRERLKARGTDAADDIENRIGKAEYEISFADRLDYRVVNDMVDRATDETRRLITDFIGL